MSDIAIRVDGLSKLYRIGGKQQRYKTLRDTLTGVASAPLNVLKRPKVKRPSGSNFWALKNISFQINRGEVVGIVGRNGAGKSTLLKILSRITDPTEGEAEIRGRVGSLLEVGTGFHNELTGRENIYLNGAILGMKRGEIQKKFDEIVVFAEVEKFIDTPVKHYSSGMYLRLAFSVAAHLEPEILLVDEVLAVGDAAFQEKCLGKMSNVAREGRTVLFVSHNMTAILQLASRCVMLEGGAVSIDDSAERVVERYVHVQRGGNSSLNSRHDRLGDGVVRIEDLRFIDRHGNVVSSVGAGDPLTIEVDYRSEISNLKQDELVLDLHFVDPLGHRIGTASTRFNPPRHTMVNASVGTLVCNFPSIPFTASAYAVDYWLAYRGGMADSLLRATELRVTETNYYGTGHLPILRKHGPLLLNHSWSIKDHAGYTTCV